MLPFPARRRIHRVLSGCGMTLLPARPPVRPPPVPARAPFPFPLGFAAAGGLITQPCLCILLKIILTSLMPLFLIFLRG